MQWPGWTSVGSNTPGSVSTFPKLTVVMKYPVSLVVLLCCQVLLLKKILSCERKRKRERENEREREKDREGMRGAGENARERVRGRREREKF